MSIAFDELAFMACGGSWYDAELPALASYSSAFVVSTHHSDAGMRFVRRMA